MSFSKAKLKRFNEISVTDSPYSDRAERKESIKKLMKELSRDGEHKKTQTTKDIHGNVTATVTSAVPSMDSGSSAVKCHTTETITTATTKTKSCTLRLFRTPSLPRRLKFKSQSTDVTPKDKTSSSVKNLFKDFDKKDPTKEALEAAQMQIKNKTDCLLEYEQLIEDMRRRSYELSISNRHKDEIIDHLQQRVHDLTKEVKDSDRANVMLKEISEKSIEKIEILEDEIRLLLKNHENEIDFLIDINAEEEKRSESYKIKLEKLREEMISVKTEFDDVTDVADQLQMNLQKSFDKVKEVELSCKRFMDENVKLLTEIDEITQKAEKDRLNYIEENEQMIQRLENLKQEKTNLLFDISVKEGVISALNDEIITKEVELDLRRDDIKLSLNTEVSVITAKYEQQIATMTEMNEMKIKEIESIAVLEKTKLIAEHTEMIKNMKINQENETQRINDTTEEKIRISEVQMEQRLAELEKTFEHSIEQEKSFWKNEIARCQKIAESEIMECEFEKRDLKTLLESANELMREKDDKIVDLQLKLNKEISNYVRIREEFENEIKEARKECSRLMTEKYNYQLTLSNTRSTVNILMERLKKSDTDVEILKKELEILTEEKLKEESLNIKLSEELAQLKVESDEYRAALACLRNSSLALEREMKDKESVFEKLMTSEEETLETVNKIGKLFNDKLEENIGKYIEMYNELKVKYDAREMYIKDMKALLDEFATGIELARIELDSKDKLLYELQQENKNFKMENMTYRFRCEHFENEQRTPKYMIDTKTEDISEWKTSSLVDEDGMISKLVIAKIIDQLDNDNLEAQTDVRNSSHFCDEDKLVAENSTLKEKLAEKTRQIELHATENLELKKKLDDVNENMQTVEAFAKITADKYAELESNQKQCAKQKQITQLRDSNRQLRNKICQLHGVNEEQENKKNKEITKLRDSNYELRKKVVELFDVNEKQENKITELNEQVSAKITTTPCKLNVSTHGNLQGTPKTPKIYTGKENQSPLPSSAANSLVMSPKPTPLRQRN